MEISLNILKLLFKVLFSRYMVINEPCIALNINQIEELNKFKEKLIAGKYLFEDASCICGNPLGIEITKYDRYGLPVRTFLCNKCGTMWTSPRFTTESIKKFYEEDYRGIYVGFNNASNDFFLDQVQHGEKIFNTVSVLFKNSKPKKVFDVGCGAGGVLVPFKNAGWDAFGCDLNPTYLIKGRELGLTLEVGDVTTLALYGQADLVILSHVVEHFPDPVSYLHEILKILKEDGLLYIEVPGILNLFQTYRDFRLFFQNAHLYHYTLTTLSSMAAKSGFKLFNGNEQVQAVFRKNGFSDGVSSAKEPQRILTYLLFFEVKKLLVEKLHLKEIRQLFYKKAQTEK